MADDAVSKALGSFEKLEGVSNYNNWKFLMKMTLTMEGLWSCVEIVEGNVIDPVKDQKALARICLAVKSSCLQYVRNATTARDAWASLSRVFEDKGIYRRVVLLRKLHHSQYNDFENMGAYIEGLMTLVQQLADIGKVIEDQEIAEILLSGLPQDYDVLVSNLETANVTNTLSSELVRTRLLQEESRKSSNDNTSDAALITARKMLTCHYCKRKGHVKAKCFKLKKDKKNTSDQVLLTKKCCTFNEEDWIIDSGATAHMCKDIKWFSNLKRCEDSVTVANNEHLACVGRGDVTILVKNDTITLTDVMLIPGLSTNLISVSKLCEKALSVRFQRESCLILRGDSLITTASKVNNIYKLDNVLGSSRVNCSFSQELVHTYVVLPGGQDALVSGLHSALDKTAFLVSTEVWHKRLGHLSFRGMCALQNLVSGVMFQTQHDAAVKDCVSCVEGKQTVKMFPKGEAKRAKQILELIHSDVCGPMPVSSLGGARYLLTFTDDYSRKTFGYLLKNKSEVMSKFKIFKATVEKQTNFFIKRLRSDNGGEYCNRSFAQFLLREGIIHETTVPYSPQQNGVSERLNRTLIEKARCMLQESGLGKQYWGEAVSTAIYLKNRSPTAALPGKTPEEVWSNCKVDLSHLRVFGCKALSLIPANKRDKFDAKSKHCILVGYAAHSKGYRLIDPSNPKQIIVSRNVVFIENEFINHKVNLNDDNMNNKNFNNNDQVLVNNIDNNSINNNVMNESNNNSINNDNESYYNCNINFDRQNVSSSLGELDIVNTNNQSSLSPTSRESSFRSAAEPESDEDENATLSDETFVRGEGMVSDPQVPVTGCERNVRSTRSKKPIRYDDYDLSDSSLLVRSFIYEEPLSYEEAMASSYKDEWQAAMQAEFDSLIKNNVWKLVDRPNDHGVVKCKWVYKMKNDSSGNFTKFKARLVARGFSQRQGIDYDETFSPVVRHSTMRLLFCIANEFDMDIEHVDVTTAFLHGDLSEIVYMEQPIGYVCNKNQVCLLNKSIYGLKQASRVWNCKVNNLLCKNGYVQTKCEPCVYIKKSNGLLTIVALYVDDFYIFSNCTKDKNNLCDLLKSQFDCKHLGSLKDCLGIKVHRDKNRGMLILCQSEYIKKLLFRFGMSDCKSISSPMAINCKLEKPNDNCLLEETYPYRELIGCLMYLSVCTRPDISFALSQLSQFNTGFARDHWLAAKRILRYLKGTINYGLTFIKSGNLNVSVFADADWANDVTDRKSYSGFVIKVGDSTVNWESRKQRCVALSSTEAEYLAIGDACKEFCFVKNFMYEIFDKMIPCSVYNDNQSALKLLEEKEYCHKKTKHIDLRFHFVKDVIKNCNVVSKYLPTDKMVADILTKPLSSSKHSRFVYELSLRNVEP